MKYRKSTYISVRGNRRSSNEPAAPRFVLKHYYRYSLQLSFDPCNKTQILPSSFKISMMSILRSSVSSRGSKRCRGGAVGMHDSRLTLACLWQQKADLPVSSGLIIPNNNQCWRTLNGKSGPAFLKVNAKFALPLCSNNMCLQPANELPNSFWIFSWPI